MGHVLSQYRPQRAQVGPSLFSLLRLRVVLLVAKKAVAEIGRQCIDSRVSAPSP